MTSVDVTPARRRTVIPLSAVPPIPAGPGRSRVGWRGVYERLAVRDQSSLSPAEADALAEALFWLDRPEESVATRRYAYRAHLEAGDLPGAAMSAWQLYFDHALVGEAAAASGWLERARRHVGPRDGSVVDGLVAVAEADQAQQQGDLDGALLHAERAVEIGDVTGDVDLLAMALQTHGRLLVAHGRVSEGLARLDEAMVAVAEGELTPLFTGWVFCAVLAVCQDVADLRRAAEWTDAALRWCDGMEEGLLYPGLCRIHRVELACLQGAWTTAAAEARRACEELLSHDPRYAGQAVYLAAEMHRLRGELDEAESGFRRAHELGREPQPGLALTWLAQGRPEAAVAALRLARQAAPTAPLARAGLLAALIEAEIATDQPDRAAAAARELSELARLTSSPYLGAMAKAAAGTVQLAQGDVSAALVPLRAARAVLGELGMPYQEARVRLTIGTAARAAGDEGTALLELRAALSTFEQLGAKLEVGRTRRLLGDDLRPAGPLTPRETEVLRLVACGHTNREIGEELTISEHTVARHISNILTKLDLTSRVAATAFAYEHHLLLDSDHRRDAPPS